MKAVLWKTGSLRRVVGCDCVAGAILVSGSEWPVHASDMKQDELSLQYKRPARCPLLDRVAPALCPVAQRAICGASGESDRGSAGAILFSYALFGRGYNDARV